MTAPASLLLSQCSHCHSVFLPRAGGCPRCASNELAPRVVPANGTVLAATEVVQPPEGWSSPHRLALVEVAEGVRLIGVVGGELPSRGAAVVVERDGTLYRIRAGPTVP